MKILKINVNGKILRIKDCRGLSSIKGVMFDHMNDYDGALISGNSIWMPFVKHKMKLVFLDDDFTVIDSKDAVPISFSPLTWRIYSSWGAKYCLETKSSKNFKVGDKIKISERI